MDGDITVSYINVPLKFRTFAFLTRITPQQIQKYQLTGVIRRQYPLEKFSNATSRPHQAEYTALNKNAGSQMQRNCSLRRAIHHIQTPSGIDWDTSNGISTKSIEARHIKSLRNGLTRESMTPQMTIFDHKVTTTIVICIIVSDSQQHQCQRTYSQLTKRREDKMLQMLATTKPSFD